MSQYFPKPYEPFVGDINVQVDLSIYAAKADIKSIYHVDTSSFALKTSLASLKTEVDKSDISKLASIPGDFTKLSDDVKNLVKKSDYSVLKTKVDAINTNNYLLKSTYATDKSTLEATILSSSTFVTRVKFAELENKLPNIKNLASKSDLTVVENKIPNVNGLITKTVYNAKIIEIDGKLNNQNHDKYITTPEVNTLAADVFCDQGL